MHYMRARAQRDQKVSDLLEQELQVVMSHAVSAGNPTRVLCKISILTAGSCLQSLLRHFDQNSDLLKLPL